MRLLIPLLTILSPLFATGRLGTKKGDNLKRELQMARDAEIPQGSHKKLLRRDLEYSRSEQHELLRKLNRYITSKRRKLGKMHSFKRRPLTHGSLPIRLKSSVSVADSPSDILLTRPPERKSNVLSPNTSNIANTGEQPNGDFDEVVTEEGTASQSSKKDEALLRKLMMNETENGLETEYSDRSPEKDRNFKSQRRNSHTHPRGEHNKISKGVRKVKDKLVSQEKLDNNDKNKEMADENMEKDGTKAELKVQNAEEQLSRFLNNGLGLKNDKAQSLLLSNEVPNQAVLSFGTFTNHQQPFKQISELETKQRVFSPQPQFSVYPDPIPRYAMPQLWHLPVPNWRFPLALAPTVPFYPPPVYLGVISRATLPQTRGNNGYTINVNGFKGVFSKGPGFALRFHSPDSEVTVTKKRNNVVAPIRW
ncbi:uncharacterized protein [Acropora muricata]|uniref:uncharacterized protein n=1 Tax=Acropora muricata TaxID=159855 RepID=UPI0034E5D81C